MDDWTALDISSPADREAVALVLVRHGYTVRISKIKPAGANKSKTILEYRR